MHNCVLNVDFLSYAAIQDMLQRASMTAVNSVLNHDQSNVIDDLSTLLEEECIAQASPKSYW